MNFDQLEKKIVHGTLYATVRTLMFIGDLFMGPASYLMELHHRLNGFFI